nr:A287 [uncultured bacterium]
MSSMKLARKTLLAATASASLFAADAASAGAKFSIDDTHWVSVGAGLRTSFSSVEDMAPDGGRSNDFLLDSIRLYVNAQVHQYIMLEFNTERYDTGSDEDIRVLDGIAKFTIAPEFNIWAGRQLPPSDRANLDGPYYLNAWTFPIAQAYPAIFAGRDNGVAVNGSIDGGVFGYAFGAYDGIDKSHYGMASSNPNQDDNLLFAGRLQWALWDPEPGFYTTSSYFGEKNILTFGAAAQYQSDGTGMAGAPGDFFGWNVDALLEHKVGDGGAASLEGAYYDYDHDDKVPAFGYQGTGYYVLASYLTPQKFGIGKLQPHVRYQAVSDDNGPDHDRWEVGLGYIIDGQKAKVIATYGADDYDGSSSTDFFILGVQLQI